MSDVRELIIVGGGPAGYTAALYAARANLRPLVIEGFNWGGQLMITSDVENYPGYPDGVMGPEMMAEFRRQAERFGADFVTDDVTRVDFSERPFGIWVENEEYRAKTVVVATGASARWLGLPGEQRLQGRGVSACATCDGAFFKEKELIVVGGGDTAMEEAAFLTRYASKVTRRPPARRVPRLADHGRPRPREPEDRVRHQRRRRGHPRRDEASRARCCATRGRTRRRSCAPTACSSPSATTRTRRCSSASSTTTRRAIS